MFCLANSCKNIHFIKSQTIRNSNKKMDNLDITQLAKIKDLENHSQRVLRKFSPSANYSEYYFYDKENNISTSILNNTRNEYVKCVYYYDQYVGMHSLIADVSFYNQNGLLLMSGSCYAGSFVNPNNTVQSLDNYIIDVQHSIWIGSWKEYDSLGNVLKVKNHEDGFNFTLKDVLDYIHSISDLSPNAGGGIQIRRIDRQWEIFYCRSDNTDSPYVKAFLDGNSGAILSEERKKPKQF